MHPSYFLTTLCYSAISTLLTSHISSDRPLHASLFLPITFPSWLSFCHVSLAVQFLPSRPFFPHCLLFVFLLSSVIILLSSISSISLCYFLPVFFPPHLLTIASSLSLLLLWMLLYLCFPSPSLLTMYIQCTALVLSPFIMTVPLCLLLPEPDSYLIFSLRQQLWFKFWLASHWLSLHGWTHVNCSPGFTEGTHAVIDWTQPGAAATHFMPTPSPLAAGLFCTDNYFMDSFHRYLHPSAFKSSCFSPSPSPSLPFSPNCQLCFTNRAVILSLRGTPFPLPWPAVRLDLPWQWAYLVHGWTRISYEKNTHAPSCMVYSRTCINANIVQNNVDVAHSYAQFDLTLTWHKTPPLQPRS